jgi:glycosyltransferase involved in cell wall biosynthesis
MSTADIRRFHAEHPDAGRARVELAENSLHLHESLLGRWLSPKKDLRKSILLDVRGVPSYFNGTAEAVLAICDALKKIGTDWNVVLWAEPEAAKYHSMESRYGPWPVVTKECNRHFTVAFRPSQPWDIETMLELHRRALINLFTMLDTISWDILSEAPIGLGAAWDFMCQYADGLTYDSFYTRNHMLHRFPAAESTPSYVSHLSFDPRDYVTEDHLDLTNSGNYIFIIGNGYAHKHVAPTLALLRSSFPSREIKVLGLEIHSGPAIEGWGSGKLPAAEIESLFARAQVIVFPSLYEGFGFPILKGLSYGRTVVARKSALLCEIAANYRGPGKLLAYSTPVDLVNTLGRVFSGFPLDELALGGDLANGEKPTSWQDVARDLIAFVERQMSRPEDFRWEQRERARRQLTAFCT